MKLFFYVLFLSTSLQIWAQEEYPKFNNNFLVYHGFASGPGIPVGLDYERHLTSSDLIHLYGSIGLNHIDVVDYFAGLYDDNWINLSILPTMLIGKKNHFFMFQLGYQHSWKKYSKTHEEINNEGNNEEVATIFREQENNLVSYIGYRFQKTGNRFFTGMRVGTNTNIHLYIGFSL